MLRSHVLSAGRRRRSGRRARSGLLSWGDAARRPPRACRDAPGGAAAGDRDHPGVRAVGTRCARIVRTTSAPAAHVDDRARRAARRGARGRRPRPGADAPDEPGVAGLDAGLGDARALDGDRPRGVPGRPRRRRRPSSTPPAASWRPPRSASRSWPTRRRSSGDTSASQQQLADYQSRVSQAAGQVATALARLRRRAAAASSATCRTPPQYDQADLARFTSDVQTVCAEGDRRQRGAAARAPAMRWRAAGWSARGAADRGVRRAAGDARHRCRRASCPRPPAADPDVQRQPLPRRLRLRAAHGRAHPEHRAAAPCRRDRGSRSTTTRSSPTGTWSRTRSTLQISTYDGRDLAAAAAEHRRPGGPGDRAHAGRPADLARARERRPGDRRRRHGRRLPAGQGAHRSPRGTSWRARPTRSTRTSARCWSPTPPSSTAARAPPCSTPRAAWSAWCTPRTTNGRSFVVPVSTLRSMLDDEASFTPARALHRLTLRRTSCPSRASTPPTVTRAVNDTLTVRRVFGEAYERNGTLVIPVARVWGGDGVRRRARARAAAPVRADGRGRRRRRVRRPGTAAAAGTACTSRRSACSSSTTPARTGGRRSTSTA